VFRFPGIVLLLVVGLGKVTGSSVAVPVTIALVATVGHHCLDG
jgi:hypothetical protein